MRGSQAAPLVAFCLLVAATRGSQKAGIQLIGAQRGFPAAIGARIEHGNIADIIGLQYDLYLRTHERQYI
ncbi:MAG: hypothetical protein JO107_16160 [Hyphomicrobiales bacterium]|nr:hypothetical protein [Hyphomicrobiales bacterium]